MIDQEKARKFWTGWVRREIGGNDMIQQAAVSAALNEVLLGRDNRAAAEAARDTAHWLGGDLPLASITPPTATLVSTPAPTSTRDAPFPTSPERAKPTVESTIPPRLSAGKPLFRRPWPYAAVGAGVAVVAIVVILGGRSFHNLGCLVGQATLGGRMTRLHNAFVDVYNRDSKVMDACQSVDCERAPKLEIAASLKTFNDGLGKICWPDKYKTEVTALTQANTAMADAFINWATATTPAEDESLQSAAREQDKRQGAADDILAHDLGVPSATPVA